LDLAYPNGLKLDAIKMQTLHDYCKFLPESVHSLYPAPDPEELKRAQAIQKQKREARRNVINRQDSALQLRAELLFDDDQANGAAD
jgi:hypothetical protein